MKQIKTKILNINQVLAVWALGATILFTMGLYIYFVNMTVLYTAQRQEMEEVLTDTRSQISQLELNFIENNRSVTKEYAKSLGFTEIKSVAFLNRSDTSLTLNEQQ